MVTPQAPEDALYLYTQDGSKRARTPGGVFWKIIKTSEDIESQDKRYHSTSKIPTAELSYFSILSFIFRGNTTRQNKIRRDKAVSSSPSPRSLHCLALQRIDLIFANLSCFAPSDPRVRAVSPSIIVISFATTFLKIRDIVAALGMTETTIAERLIEKKASTSAVPGDNPLLLLLSVYELRTLLSGCRLRPLAPSREPRALLGCIE